MPLPPLPCLPATPFFFSFSFCPTESTADLVYLSRVNHTPLLLVAMIFPLPPSYESPVFPEDAFPRSPEEDLDNPSLFFWWCSFSSLLVTFRITFFLHGGPCCPLRRWHLFSRFRALFHRLKPFLCLFHVLSHYEVFTDY